MCRNNAKAGCVCHWSELEPDHSRLRVPSTPVRSTSAAQNAAHENSVSHTLRRQANSLQQVALGPPPTPIRPLGSSSNVNASARPSGSARKRKHGPNSSHKAPAAKRRNPGTSGNVFGVGPPVTPIREDDNNSVDNEAEPTPKKFPTLTRPNHEPSNSRQDIWMFMRVVHEDQKEKYRDTGIPLPTLPRITSRPRSDHVGCMLCEEDGKRTLYSNLKNGQTTTIGNHLRTHPRWTERCQQLGITQKVPAVRISKQLESVQNEPYSSAGLLKYLLRWITADDQSVNVVECPEFRQLLLYIGRQLRDSDIPHRTKTTGELKRLFKEMMDSWIREVQNCPGRVSFTTDLWTDPNLHPFMAVTAHYVLEKETGWTLEARLIAFRHMPGSHDGISLGNSFVDILETHKLTHKVGQITADNASNNGTMIEAMEEALLSRGIPFSRSENRVRCFPHVINLAVQDFITSISSLDNHFGIAKDVYDAIRADPIKRCRELVASIRLTSQRREEFRNTIANAKRNGSFDGKSLELLRDMTVRWSSTFNMIDRFLTMSKAVDLYLARPNNRDLLLSHGMDKTNLEILDNIHKVLLLPNTIQEVVSSERTPTAAVSLPAYEYCMQSLIDITKNDTFPHLNHAIYRVINKIEKYVKIARTNHVYGIAMFINPSCKKTWMTTHWPEAEVTACLNAVRESMVAYRKKELTKTHVTATASSSSATTKTPPDSTSSSQAHKNLHSGFQKLRAWSTLVSGSALSRQPSLSSSVSLSSAGDIEARACDDVDREIHLYLSHPVIGNDISACDILAFWQAYHQTYPILWKVARDILPVQASSVSCERIFSSAKLTTTLQRSRMSPEHVEMLQILKFGFKQEELSFTKDWVMTAEEIQAEEHLDDVSE